MATALRELLSVKPELLKRVLPELPFTIAAREASFIDYSGATFALP